MDSAEFNIRLMKHKNLLRNYAYNLTRNIQDAEDLFQDTYLRAFTYREKFTETTNFRAWTCTIMKNIFINAYRRSVKKRNVIDQGLEGEPFYANTGKANIEDYAEREDLAKAIERLREDYRYCFKKFFEGYKYKEIADELNIPIGNIKTNIYMARRKLKLILAI